MRRLLPLVRQHEAQLQIFERFKDIADLGRQREDAAVKLIEEAGAAVRDKSAAAQLRSDIAERRSAVAPDPAALAEADEIDRLIIQGGAETKATSDLVAIEAEHETAKTLGARLCQDAGANAHAAPTRAVAGRLRDLARIHGELLAASQEIAESREDIEARRIRANAQLGDSSDTATSKILIDSVDIARTLGTDADVRCQNARRKADVAASSVASTLARLAPWVGDIGDLLKLPLIDATEFDGVRSPLNDAAAEVKRFVDEARRSAEATDAAALAIAQMETGSAVSPEEIAEARDRRDQHWQPLRQYMLEGALLDTPEMAVEQFETSVDDADERMDLRFALADASGRLSVLEQTKARHELEKTQAEAGADKARERQCEMLARWIARLEEAGLPALDPVRFQTWQTDRERVQKAELDFSEFQAEADNAENRRDGARAALCVAQGIADPGGALAPLLVAAERSRDLIEKAAQSDCLVRAELEQVDTETATLDRRQQRLETERQANATQWQEALAQASLQIDVSSCNAILDLLDELREAMALQASLCRRIDGIARDAREHSSEVDLIADKLGLNPAETKVRLRMLKERLTAAREAATIDKAMGDEDDRREREASVAEAKLKAAEDALAPLLLETKAADRTELLAIIEQSRSMRVVQEEIAKIEQDIVSAGDGLSLVDLIAAISASDPETILDQVDILNARIAEINDVADDAATAHGDARQAFMALQVETTSAVDAAADAAQARSELEALAEHFILKRAEAVTLKWAIETYRKRNQNPLLVRAGELLSTLTNGRYVALRVETDGSSPRLLGLRDDGRTAVEVDAMSEGTTDQLFLALRLAGVEQSVAAGVNLPFLADDLFVNFDDERAEAGFRVLAEVAKSTQVLFFTHHPHLVGIAKSVVGSELHSECTLQ